MRNYMSALMTFVLLLIIATAISYLARRTAFVFNVRPFWFYFGYAFLLIFLFVIMGGAMSWSNTGTFAHIVISSSAVITGVLLYLLLCTIAVDIVNFYVWIPPKLFGIIVAALTLMVSGYALWNAATPRIKNVQIELPQLSRPMEIVQFSDIHLGQFRGKNNLQKLVDLANSTNAEAVVITGDIFDSHYNCDIETLRPLEQLNMPSFFVDGNHDIYTDVVGIKEMLKEVGVHVLSNEMTQFGELQIIGLDYMNADNQTPDMMHVAPNRETISSILPKFPIDKEKPSILLHHNPTGLNYVEEAGIGLYLAGHTHGGQLFPFIWLNDYIFKYNRGLYRLGKSQIYVSVGSGTFGPPMRLGTRSEVTLIELVPVK